MTEKYHIILFGDSVYENLLSEYRESYVTLSFHILSSSNPVYPS